MTSDTQPLRVWDLLATLVDAQVDFFVIGGLAVAVHGFERATKEVDVVPAPARDNLERLHAALTSIEAEPLELGDFRPVELPHSFSPDGLAQGGNWFLRTRYGRVDVMQFLEDVLESEDDYRDHSERAMSLETPVGTVLFVAYEDLLRMKYAAGRDVDLVDIRAMREARGELE